MQITHIDSLDDPRLSDYRDLTDVALRRVSEPAGGLYIAESSKVITRALAAGHRPRSVLLLEKWVDDVAPLVEDFDVPVFVGESALLEHLTGFTLHRGALASMHRPPLPNVADLLAEARRVVVIEDVVDHTNVGAIFRSVAGLGADAVLITPRCADPLYRRSVRVSMGTVLQVPWTRLAEWPAGADELHAAGFHIAALALADDAVSLDGEGEGLLRVVEGRYGVEQVTERGRRGHPWSVVLGRGFPTSQRPVNPGPSWLFRW